VKIAMIGQRGVPATFGGIERHVEEIGARLVADGHEVVVFCRKGYGESEPATYRGLRLVHQRTVDSKHLEAIFASATATLTTIGRGFDVVHFHAVGPGLLTPVARLLTRARVVQTIHGFDGERAKWGRAASLLLRLGTWLSAHVPHATVVVSKALQEAYRERYGRETVHIVNGAPDAAPLPAAAITERWGLTKGSYVLFVGRLVPEKAPELLIEAFSGIEGEHRLVIAGGSSHTDGYVEDLQRLAAADPRVIMAGYVYGDELRELYANAALFVLPSLLEGLPLTLLEAASHGCAVVASDIPPHVEVLGASGPGARLVPTGDVDALAKAIGEALHAPAEEERAGADALSERVRATYSWDRATADTAALYERLLARRPRWASWRRRGRP
jgi:glycosyltransferase involved in cell wall biosynthesis